MNKTFTNMVIFICAVLSGVLNYAGLAQLVPPDDWFARSLCAMTGVAVTLSLTLFWNYAFGTVPDLRHPRKRLAGWVTVLAGVIAVISLSTYWNLMAIGGSEINRQSSGDLVSHAELRFADAVNTSGQYQSLNSDIIALSADIRTLISNEVDGGGSSGSSGEGAVSSTMGQVQTRVENTLKSIAASTAQLNNLREGGSVCLNDLRKASATGNQIKLAAEIACVNGVMADLGNLNILSSIERSMASLTDGIVLPATLKTDRQRQIIAEFLAKAKKRGDGIAKSSKSIVQSVIEPLSADMPNQILGVLLHWKSLLPALATALGIDLLPLIILVFKTLRSDDQRGRGKPRHVWTGDELEDALRQLDQLRDTLQLGGDMPSPFIDLPQTDWVDVRRNEGREADSDDGPKT